MFPLFFLLFEQSTDEDHRTKEEEIEDSSIKEEVTYCIDQSKDLVTAVWRHISLSIRWINSDAYWAYTLIDHFIISGVREGTFMGHPFSSPINKGRILAP